MSKVVEFQPHAAAMDFVETRTQQDIRYALQDCHSRGLLAVIRGGFGIGKTFALDRYATARESDVAMVTLDPTTKSLTAGLVAVCESVASVWEWYFSGTAPVTSYTVSSAHAARLAIERFCRGIAKEGGRLLLIVDEAQYARPDLLDALRALHDKKLFGFVVSGNEQLFNPRENAGEKVSHGSGGMIPRRAA